MKYLKEYNDQSLSKRISPDTFEREISSRENEMFTDKEISELKNIFKDEFKLYLIRESLVEIYKGAQYDSEIIITIGKFKDEWFTVSYRNTMYGNRFFFLVDTFDGISKIDFPLLDKSSLDDSKVPQRPRH